MLGVPEKFVHSVQKITDFQAIYDIGLPEYALRNFLESVYTSTDWSFDSLTDTRYIFYRANADQLEDYCKGKVKQLMLDLAPEQQKLVDYKTTGPTLIKGVAGSGKTTIGIYRAISQETARVVWKRNNSFLDLFGDFSKGWLSRCLMS